MKHAAPAMRVCPVDEASYTQIHGLCTVDLAPPPVLIAKPSSPGFDLHVAGGLRMGFRRIEGLGQWRFEVYKGIGLACPPGQERWMESLAALFGIPVRPLAHQPDGLFRRLDLSSLGSESKWGGAAHVDALVDDGRRYVQLATMHGLQLPGLAAVYAWSPAFARAQGLPTGDGTCWGDLPDRACGQAVRVFRNAFRVDDLWMLDQVARRLPEHAEEARERAMAIVELWASLEGCDQAALGPLLATRLGQQASALANHRVVHGRLSFHLQNVTLAGEVTEFDVATIAPRVDERFDVQMLLLANHARQTGECLRALGVDARWDTLADAFGEAARREWPSPTLSHTAVEGVRALVDNPIKRLVLGGHEPFSRRVVRMMGGRPV